MSKRSVECIITFMSISKHPRGFPIWAAILASAVVCAFTAFVIAIIRQDQSIPDGYVKASNAKVSKVITQPCRPFKNHCTGKYDVIAIFSVKGESYYPNVILTNAPAVGDPLNLYYDPTDPLQVKFPGEQTSGSLPFIVGFLIFALLFIWASYALSKKTIKIGPLISD
jgi:hypothetical protein